MVAAQPQEGKGTTLKKSDRRRFYASLKRAKPYFTWMVAKGGKIRGLRSGRYYCPLTAICKYETGGHMPISAVHYIKFDTMELKDEDVDLITISSDRPSWELPEMEQRVLRKTMLKIIGVV